MRSRHTAGRPPFGAIALACSLAACGGTLAWELRSFGPILPGREPRPATLPLARPQPPRPALEERHRRDHRRGGDPVAAAFERGVAAYNADDVEAAADAFEEAVRLAPDEPEARINLGLVYLRLQRPDDAMRELAMGASLVKSRKER